MVSDFTFVFRQIEVAFPELVIVNTENFNCSDLDLAQGFKQTRNLTSSLSTKILNDFLLLSNDLKKSLSNSLPAQYANELDQYFDNVKEQFKAQIKILFQSSHFGILDRDLVESFIVHYLRKSEDNKLNNSDFDVLAEFQDGMHGCLPLKSSLIGTEIAHLDLRLTERAMDDLNRSIIRLARARVAEKPKPKTVRDLTYHVNDVAHYVAATGQVERKINNRVEAFSNDPSASQLGISNKEIDDIKKEYQKIFQIEGFVGRTQYDNIIGEEFSEEALLNSFTVQESSLERNLVSPDFAKNYERLVLEVGLLACFHALSEHMDKTSDKKRESVFKSPKFSNFKEDHVPWLKEFYESQLNKCRNLIKIDPAPRKTSKLALRMCSLSQRLSSPAVDYYESNDFFVRYHCVQNIYNVKNCALSFRLFAHPRK